MNTAGVVFVLLTVVTVCVTDVPKWQKADPFLFSVFLNHWKSNVIPKPPYKPNLMQLAKSLNLTKLVKAMEETGLDNTVDHEGPFTFFAPTNEAFNRIPSFAKNVSLFEMLSYHVARAKIPKEHMKNEMLVRSLLSKRDIRINIYNKKVYTANGCKLLKGPYEAFNGYLYIVDDVMWSVYERQGSVLSELERCPVGSFDHFVQGLMLTGLDRMLNGNGPFTLISPDDTAWSNLPSAVVDYLTHNVTALREVLLHHIVSGTWYSEGLNDKQKLLPMAGSKITVTQQKDKLMFDEAHITLADNTAGNGVIHAVDKVLHYYFHR